MLEVIEIHSSDKKKFRQFVDFPNRLYKDCPYYMPSMYADEINLLNPKKNPAFEECKARYFLAMRDGKVVGRIAGLIQYTYNQKSGEKRMRFTRFDFINDLEVVRQLLAKVEEFAREEGMEIVHGPFGFYDLDQEGMRTDGFDRKATMATNYNYDYYYPLVKQCGYEDECEWYEYLIHIPQEIPEKIAKVAEIARKRYHLSVVRAKSMKEMIAKYQTQIFDLYDRSYGVLPGTIPLSAKVRDSVVGQFKTVMTPEFFPMVINEQGELVGIGMCFANICECFQKSGGKVTPSSVLKLFGEMKHPTGAEMAIVGVADEYRPKGAMALIMEYMFETFHKYGITEVETNPELITNVRMQSIWDDFEKEQHKKDKAVFKRLK